MKTTAEVKIICTNPNCEQHIAVDESYRGRSIQCPTCGTKMVVPWKRGAGQRPGKCFTKKRIVAGVVGIGAMIAFGITHYARQATQNASVPGHPGDSQFVKPEVTPPSWAGNAPYVAANRGDLEQLKKLLDKKPDLLNEPVGDAQATLLHTAAYNARAQIVAELLRRNADVNAQTVRGHTPLYDCVDRGTAEIAQMLLEHGADANIPNASGKSPLQFAREKNRLDIVNLLRRYGARE